MLEVYVGLCSGQFLGLHWAGSGVGGQLCVSFANLDWAASYICSLSGMIFVSFTLSFPYYPGVHMTKARGPKYE